MIDTVKKYYEEKEFDYYKNVCLGLKVDVQRSIISKKKVFPPYFAAVKSYLAKHNAGVDYEKFEGALRDYFDSNHIRVSQKYRNKKLAKILYLALLRLLGILYPLENKEQFKKLNNLKEVINLFDLDNNIVMADFGVLEDVLNELDFSQNEKADFIVEALKINLQKIENNGICYDKEAILSSDFKSLNPSTKQFLLETNSIATYIASNSILFANSRKKLKHFLEENPLNIDEVKENIKIICEILDSDEVTDLKKNELFERLHNLSITSLDKRIYKLWAKRNEMAANTPEVVLESTERKQDDLKTEEPKAMLSKKQINLIYREIAEVYDFDEKVLKVSLSMNKVIDVLAKLILINSSKKVMDEFLLVALKSIKRDPFIAVYEFLEKIAFYLDNEDIRLYYDEIEDLINKKLPFVDTEEEYEGIKEELDFCLKRVYELIGNDYSYEYQKAEELKQRMLMLSVGNK